MRIGSVLAMAMAAALTLPGCERLRQKFEPPTTYAPPDRPNDSCNSAPYREYAGQNSSALAGVFVPDPYRVIEDGAPMTMDYNPARLNFTLSADGTVLRVWCG
jgi:hypothetical protein